MSDDIRPLPKIMAEDIEAISDEEFTEGLADVLSALMAKSREEQEASEPWKELWGKADEGVYRLLVEAEEQTGRIIRDVGSVIRKKYGINISNRLYNLLKALPFAMQSLQGGIQEEQGLSCCGDKARHAYALAVLDEIKRIMEGGK